MIIANQVEDQHSPSKRSLALSQSDGSAAADLESPPPAYEPSSDGLPTHVSAQPTTPLLRNGSGRRARLRFLKAFAVACLIYATFSAVLAPGAIALVRRIHARSPSPSVPTPGVPSTPQPSAPSKHPKTGRPGQRIECHRFPGERTQAGGTSDLLPPDNPMPPIYLPDLHVPVQHLPIAFTNTSTISFTYTADLSVLFLRSLGRQASGVVTFSDGGKGSRNIIEIIIHHGAKPQDLLEICTVRDHNDPEQKQGLTIEVLDEAGWTEHVASLDISVKLGRTNDGKRPALETLMENFSHEIEPFRDDLVFPYVDFATSHGRIHSSKLRADRASIETLNGAISGSLNITDTLNLRTISGAIDVQAVASSGNFSSDNGNIRGHVVSSHQLQVSSTNGPIDMHIELINKEGSVPTRAVLSAVNNHIEAKFSLTALDHAGKPASGGAFEINGETTNGFLYLDVVDQPHLANLTLEARSLNDGATVKLNPAFEGRYAVRSIPFSHSHVENNNHYRDNKVRRFERYEGRHIVHGSAEWHSEYDEEISHGQGLISIESVRAPNRLLL